MAQQKTIVTKLTLDSKGFGQKMQAAGDVALKAGAAFSAVSAAVGLIAAKTAKYQDETIKAARSAGTTAEEFSALAHAANLAAVSKENMVKSLAKLNAPTALVQKELNKLNVSLTDSQGKTRDQSDVLDDLADRFQDMKNPVDRSAAAFRLFGARGVELVNLLKDGSEGLKKAKLEAQALGLTFTEEAGENAELFNDNLVRLQDSVKGLSMSFGSAVIAATNESGIIVKLTDTVKDLIIWFNSLDEGTKNTIIQIASMAAAFGGILTTIGLVIKVAPFFKAAFTAMTGPVGLLITAITAVTLAVMAFGNETENFIKQAEKQNKQLTKIENTYERLAKKQNKTKKETVEFQKAQRSLQLAATASGIAIDVENSTLDNQIKALTRLRKLREEQTKAKIAELKATRDIEAAVEARLLQEQIAGDTFTTTAIRQSESIRALALALGPSGALSAGLTNVNVVTGLVQQNVNSLNAQIESLEASLVPVTETSNNFGNQLNNAGNQANNSTAKLANLTNFLDSDFRKAVDAANNEYKKFIEVVNKRVEAGKLDAGDLVAYQDLANQEIIKRLKKLTKEREKIFTDSLLSETDKEIIKIKELEKVQLAAVSDTWEGRKLIANKEFNSLSNSTEKDYKKLQDKLLDYDKRRLKELTKVSNIANEKIRNARISAASNTIQGITGNANEIIKVFSGVSDVIVSRMQRAEQVAARDFQIRIEEFRRAAEIEKEILEKTENDKLSAMEKAYDEQIEALKKSERERLGILEGGANERLLLLDKEFQAQKEALEKQFELIKQNAINQYNFEQSEIEKKSYDKEQALLADSILTNDFNLLLENLQKEHDQRVIDLSKEFTDKKKLEEEAQKDESVLYSKEAKDQIEKLTAEKNKSLEQLETEKAANLKRLAEQQAAEQKELEKKRAYDSWQAQKAQFEATKAVKISETITSGIAAAAQAFASLASIPFVGIALGIAAAGTIAATMAVRVADITKQAPIPPAELFMKSGGVIAGSKFHSVGGVSANLESGEAVIDRERTARLFQGLDSVTENKTISINFESGSIVTSDSIISDDMIDQFSEKIGQRLQQGGF